MPGNRLAAEKSPYLLQHADNPVDWRPWSEEAFEEARRLDKPIFLSIGYSTCHWCHVMTHESFEDTQVAEMLNDVFVNIKVDREERPDIDNVYMTACRIMTGSGGWPLTVIMTPDKRPFYAATYIPRQTRFGRTGMLDLIPAIKSMWLTRRDEVLDAAAGTGKVMAEAANQAAPGTRLDAKTLAAAQDGLAARYDPVKGGFSQTVKFPSPHNFLFLLRRHHRTGNIAALKMVETTLTAMRLGGIFDQVGYGFHRYSTDRNWLVPHFEKMLYDQALAVMAYAETYRVTGNPLFAETAGQVIKYIKRDLASPEGAFYCAEDADSQGVEGKFYVWTAQEIQDLLGNDADLVMKVLGVRKHGNFREESTGERPGTNILHLAAPLPEIAAELKTNGRDLAKRIEAAREKLLAARSKRPRPHLDDKILTDWNGLTIAALAKAARILDDPALAEDAENAAKFILSKLTDNTGRLMHRYRDGQAAISGMLDDYAFLAWGLIDLYQAVFNPAWLEQAIRLTETMIELFHDPKAGAFFLTPEHSRDLPVRLKEFYDGALPSGNSAAMYNLVRLARMTGNTKYEDLALDIGRAFSRQINEVPSAHTLMMCAVDFALGPSVEAVVAGDLNRPDTWDMIKSLNQVYAPNMVILHRPDSGGETAELVPFAAEMNSINGRAAAYICRGFSCQSPTTDPQKAAELASRAGRPGPG